MVPNFWFFGVTTFCADECHNYVYCFVWVGEGHGLRVSGFVGCDKGEVMCGFFLLFSWLVCGVLRRNIFLCRSILGLWWG